MSTFPVERGLVREATLLDALPTALVGADAQGVILWWNAGAEALYGWTAADAVGRHIADVLWGDAADVDGRAIRASVLAGEPWQDEFRVARKDGTPFIARVRLKRLVRDDGSTVMLGISEDVSDTWFERARSSESADRLRLALDATGLGTWEWDVGTGRVAWDPRTEEIFGYEAGTFPGTYDAWHDLLHPDDREQVLSSVQHAVALRSRNTIEHRILRHGDGAVRWVESHSKSVIAGDGSVRGTIGCVRDITALKLAEAERQRLRRFDEFLFEASERLAESLEIDQTLAIVADVTVPAVADWCVIHLVTDRGLRLALLRHRQTHGQLVLSRLLARYPTTLDGGNAVATVVKSGEPHLISVIPPDTIDALVSAGDERAAAFRELGVRSLTVLPLQARGSTVGAVTFGRDREEPFDAAQQSMLEQLTSRAALAIDNALTYDNQRRAALTLQHSLLPDIAITAPGLSIATRYYAGAAGSQVGGDWYDALTLPDGRIGVTVGDVMGHGLASAALMGQVRAALRGIAATGAGPAEVLRILDGVVGTLSETQLVTCGYGIYDPATSTIVFACAGHLPPLLVRPNETPQYLDIDPGTPLGVQVGAGDFPLTTAVLERGSTVMVFTDGLVESRQRSLSLGLETLRAMAARPEEDLERLCDRLVAGMHAGVDADDDTALLVLRVD